MSKKKVELWPRVAFCKNILEQYSLMYFGYVKEKYIELLYEKKKKKMTPENLGRHRSCLMGKSVIEFLFTNSHILKKEKDGQLQWQSQTM